MKPRAYWSKQIAFSAAQKRALTEWLGVDDITKLQEAVGQAAAHAENDAQQPTIGQQRKQLNQIADAAAALAELLDASPVGVRAHLSAVSHRGLGDQRAWRSIVKQLRALDTGCRKEADNLPAQSYRSSSATPVVEAVRQIVEPLGYSVYSGENSPFDSICRIAIAAAGPAGGAADPKRAIARVRKRQGTKATPE